MPIGEGNGRGVVRRNMESSTESGVEVGFLVYTPACVCVSVYNGFGVCPGRADWCEQLEVARLNQREHLP